MKTSDTLWQPLPVCGDARLRRWLRERPPARLWARLSLFVLRQSRLLVTEVFLPAILALTP